LSRKGQSITLSISERDKAALETLALEFGMTWGDRPNISKLVEAIARRQLVIAPNHNWANERIAALNRARTALMDAGDMEMAVAIARLLLERSELTIPLRAELEGFIASPAIPWRLELEGYLRRQQPFRLMYQDAAERTWQFTIHYGEIVLHDHRQYLDCWCVETEGNRDVPELHHNWCLRLDRIADANFTRVPGGWRGQLDTILVELHLFGDLAFAYQSKSNQDDSDEWLQEPPQTRRVVRRVSSSFWLIREVLRYGNDCEVVAPPTVRDRVRQAVAGLCERYGVRLD
jgi:hypothetical protein